MGLPVPNQKKKKLQTKAATGGDAFVLENFRPVHITAENSLRDVSSRLPD